MEPDFEVVVLVRSDVTNEEAAKELRALAVELGWRGLKDKLRGRS